MVEKGKMDGAGPAIIKLLRSALRRHKFRLLLCGLLAWTFFSLKTIWDVVLDVLEVRQPDLQLDQFVGNVTNCLTNPDHALGDGDLRIAFTRSNTDVVEWKLKLVREAEHSILFADVMGGNVLDFLFNILEAKVKRLPHFKVVVLHYAREDCPATYAPLERLAAAYPDRVHYFSQGKVVAYEKIHIKAVIADFGKYFTLGGSVWVDTVVFHDYDSDFIFVDCSGRLGPKLWDGVMRASILFVRTFAEKYREYGSPIVDQLSLTEKWTSSSLCAAHNAYAGPACDFASTHCNSFRNLSIPIPTPEIYYSGPGRTHNARLGDDMVEAVNNCTRRIVIAQAYFVLPERLKVALTNAAIRGVHILIVTQGDAREDKLLKRLALKGISASNDMDAIGILAKGRNVKIYKFIDSSKFSIVKSYHKKVVIADDVLFAGSPNMGPKSMIKFIDLEVAFRVQSKALADEYAGLIRKDAEKHCRGVYGVSLMQIPLAYIWHFVRSFTTFANY